jgi:hypothetical protein
LETTKKVKDFQEVEQELGEIITLTEANKRYDFLTSVRKKSDVLKNPIIKEIALFPDVDLTRKKAPRHHNVSVYLPVRKLEAIRRNILTFDEAEKKYGKLLLIQEATSYFKTAKNDGISWRVLKKIFLKGYFKDCFLRPFEDVMPHRSTVDAYVIYERVKDGILIDEHFTSLTNISKMIGVTRNTLTNWKTSGYIDLEEAQISAKYWDIKWFQENAERLLLKHKKNITASNSSIPILEILHHHGANEIVNYIKEYTNFLLGGGSFSLNDGGKKGGKKPSNPELFVKTTHTLLGWLWYKIICGRSGIENYWEMDRLGQYRALSKEEWELFDPSLFDFHDFNAADVQNAIRGYKGTNAYDRINKYFKPFMWYVFKRKKQELRDIRRTVFLSQQATPEIKEEFDVKKELLEILEEDIEMAFKTVSSIRPEVDEKDERPAIHLEREQILLAGSNIMKARFVDSLKRKTIFYTGCFTGIRNFELANLKIQDFVLDENGLLQRFELSPETEYVTETNMIIGPSVPTDKNTGYGLLKIKISKGDYSPSPKFGTYIAPSLVTQINSYLQYIYRKHPHTVGLGYLFRFKDSVPNIRYTSNGLVSWISANRDLIVDFLPFQKRKFFSYYDVRHTAANLIINQTHLDKKLEKHQVRAAELHVRHDMKNRSSRKPLILRRYASSANAEQYFKIMQEAFDFPINLKGKRDDIPYENLYDWEIKKGYRQRPISVSENQEEEQSDKNKKLSPEEQKKLDQLQKVLLNKKAFFDEIKDGYKRSFQKKYQLDESQWVYKVSEVEAEINNLEKEIAFLTVA